MFSGLSLAVRAGLFIEQVFYVVFSKGVLPQTGLE